MESVRHNIYDAENYPLIPSRSSEVEKVMTLLQISPVVFVWAPGGNGKTGFGREFKQFSPTSVSLILEAQLDSDFTPLPPSLPRPPYDLKVEEDTKIIVVDEFEPHDAGSIEGITQYIGQGKEFVFLLHSPKSRFTRYRRYHKRYLPHMLSLIQRYPEAPWLYLRKWRLPKLSSKKF